jgi:hypothetical protein
MMVKSQYVKSQRQDLRTIVGTDVGHWEPDDADGWTGGGPSQPSGYESLSQNIMKISWIVSKTFASILSTWGSKVPD